MDSFIADYPGVIYLVGLAFILYIIYQHKQGKKLEDAVHAAGESAILLEISKAVQAIEGMADQVAVLFVKDSHRKNEIQEVRVEFSERMGKQEAKCEERTFFQCVNRRVANAPDSPRRRDGEGGS